MALGGSGLADIGPKTGDDFRETLARLSDPAKIQDTLDQIDGAKAAAIQEMEDARTRILEHVEKLQAEAVALKASAQKELDDAKSNAQETVSSAETDAETIRKRANESAAETTKAADTKLADAEGRLSAIQARESRHTAAVIAHQQKVDRENEEIALAREDIERREQELTDQKEKVATFIKQLQTSAKDLMDGSL